VFPWQPTGSIDLPTYSCHHSSSVDVMVSRKRQSAKFTVSHHQHNLSIWSMSLTSGLFFVNLLNFPFVLFVLSETGRSGGLHTVEATFDVTSICNRIEGLSEHQRLLCRSYPDVTAAVGEGAKMAINECQFQFRFKQWNCSSNYGNSESIGSYLLTQSSLIGQKITRLK